MAKKVVVDMDVRTGKAEKNVENLNKDIKETKKTVKETGDNGKEAMTAIDRAAGGAIGAMRGVVTAAKSAGKAMLTLRGFVISTGIGALLLAVTSLVSYFTRTERGAQKLRVIMATLGAAVDVVADIFVGFGEAIVNAFENPKQAWDDFTESLNTGYQFIKNQVVDRFQGSWMIASGAFEAAVLKMRIAWNNFTGDADEAEKLTESLEEVNKKMTEGAEMIIKAEAEIARVYVEAGKAIREVVKEVNEEAKAAAALENAMNRIKVVERELRIARAEANAEIEKQKFIAEDINRTFEERRIAAEKAFEIEDELLQNELLNERARLGVLQQQAALGESSEETLDAIADQRVKLAELEQASATKSIELNNKINALKLEEQRVAEETAAAEQERIEAETQARIEALEKIADAQRTAEEKEVLAVQSRFKDLIKLAKKYKEDTTVLESQRTQELAAITQKYEEEKTKITEEQEAARAALREQQANAAIGVSQNVLSAVSGFLTEGSEAAKAVAIAQSVITTVQSGLEAYKSTVGIPFVGPILAPIAAAAAVAAGVAQIRKIRETKIPGSSGSSGGGSVSASGFTSGAGANIQSPSVNVLGGNRQLNQIQQSLDQQNDRPLRTYVVSGEVTSQQALDRRITDLATFG